MQIVDVLARLGAAGVQIVPMQFNGLIALISPSWVLAIDYRRIKTDEELLRVLLHELGHYETGAFYTVGASIEEWRQAEGTAKQHAMRLQNQPDAAQESTTLPACVGLTGTTQGRNHGN